MTESGGLRELEERYEGYTVYDRDGDKIGKVDELFVDESDREEYVGVKMGLFGLSGTTLVPMDIAQVNQQDRSIQVSETKSRVKDAPTYGDDDDVTHEFEDRIRDYYSLESRGSSGDRGMYEGAGAGAGTRAGGTEGREGYGDREGLGDREGYEDRERREGPEGREGLGERERREGPEGREGREGRETYENREGMGASGSAMESAGAGRQDEPSGGMDRLETGERGRTTGSGAIEGDERGMRAGSDVGDERVGDREQAGRYSDAPIEERGTREHDDMQDYQGASTGYQPGGEREGSAGMEGRGYEREPSRGEGEYRGAEEPRSVDIERGSGEPGGIEGREESGSFMGDQGYREEQEGPVRVRRRSRREQSSIDEEEEEFRRGL